VRRMPCGCMIAPHPTDRRMFVECQTAIYSSTPSTFICSAAGVSKQVLGRTIIVSKATKRHCAGTVQSQRGRVGNVKQVGFEAAETGRCGSDKIRQTVPDANSGDRKRSVTDGRQSGAADNQ